MRQVYKGSPGPSACPPAILPKATSQPGAPFVVPRVAVLLRLAQAHSQQAHCTVSGSIRSAQREFAPTGPRFKLSFTMRPYDQRGSYDRPYRNPPFPAHGTPFSAHGAQSDPRALLQDLVAKAVPQGRDPRRSPVVSQPPASSPSQQAPFEQASRPPPPPPPPPLAAPPPPPPAPITARPPQQTPSASRPPTASLQTSTALASAFVPPPFRPLVQVLEDLAKLREHKPYRTTVASRLTALDPQVYSNAGCVSWRDYSARAADAGVVELGNDRNRPGYDWIRLKSTDRTDDRGSRSPSKIDGTTGSFNSHATSSSVRGEKPVFWHGGSARNSPLPSSTDSTSSVRPHYYDKTAAWTQSFMPAATSSSSTQPPRPRPAPQSAQASVDSNPGRYPSPAGGEADSPVSSITTSSASTSSASISSLSASSASSSSAAPVQTTSRNPSPPQPTPEIASDEACKPAEKSPSPIDMDSLPTPPRVNETHQGSTEANSRVQAEEVAIRGPLPPATACMDLDDTATSSALSPDRLPPIGLGISANDAEDDEQGVFYPKMMPSPSPSPLEASPPAHLPPATITKMVDLLCSTHVDNLRRSLENEQQQHRASIEAMISRELEIQSQQIRTDFAAQLARHRDDITSQICQLRSEHRSQMDSLRAEVQKQVDDISVDWVSDAAAIQETLLTSTRKTLETSLNASMIDKLNKVEDQFKAEMSNAVSGLERKADTLSQQVDALRLSKPSGAVIAPASQIPAESSVPLPGMKSSVSPPPKLSIDPSTSSCPPPAAPQLRVNPSSLYIPSTLAGPAGWSQFFVDLGSKMRADLLASDGATVESSAGAVIKQGTPGAPSQQSEVAFTGLAAPKKANNLQGSSSLPSNDRVEKAPSADVPRAPTTEQVNGSIRDERMLEVSLGDHDVPCDDDGDTPMSPGGAAAAPKTNANTNGSTNKNVALLGKKTVGQTIQVAKSLQLPVKPVTDQQSKAMSPSASGATTPASLETRLSAASTLPSKPDRTTRGVAVREAVAAMRRDSTTSGPAKRPREGNDTPSARAGTEEARTQSNAFKRPKVSGQQTPINHQHSPSHSPTPTSIVSPVRPVELKGALSGRRSFALLSQQTPRTSSSTTPAPVSNPKVRSENDEEQWDDPLSPGSSQPPPPPPTAGMVDSWRPGDPLRAPANFKVQGLADRRRSHSRDDFRREYNGRDGFRDYRSMDHHSRSNSRSWRGGETHNGNWRSYNDEHDRFDQLETSSASEPSPFRVPRDSESPDPLQVGDNGEIVFQSTTTTQAKAESDANQTSIRSLTIKGSADSPGNASPRTPMSASTASGASGGGSALLGRISSF